MKKIIYQLVALLLLMPSCVKDDTVDTFTTLNEITIEGLAEEYKREIGTELLIEPIITTTIGTDKDLDYVWYKYDYSMKVADTIGREKNLKIIVDNIQPGVQNYISYKVIDRKTKVYVLKTVKYWGMGKYSEGTLLLHKNGSDVDFSFMRSSTGIFYENLYSASNDGMKLGANSTKIFSINPHERNPIGFKAIIITSKDENGGVYLDPVYMKRKDYMRDKFLLPIDEPILDITYSCTDQSVNYLLVNGHFYTRANTSAVVAYWLPPILVSTPPTEHQLAPYSLHPTGYPLYGQPLVYDNENGRFLRSNGSGSFARIGGVNDVTTDFDLNNIGKGIIMLACGNIGDDLDDMWALMKDSKDSKLYIYKFGFTYNTDDWTYTFTAKSKKEVTSEMAPNLATASKIIPGSVNYIGNQNPWEFSVRGVGGRLFYLNKNAVYSLSASSLTETRLIDGADEEFTIDDLYIHSIPAPTVENPSARYNRLALAIKDNKLSSKKGGIVFYRLSSLGGLTAEKYYQKTGLCDEILCIEEKFD